MQHVPMCEQSGLFCEKCDPDRYGPTDGLVAEIAAVKNRDEAGFVYAQALLTADVDFPRLNAAILERWSLAGLAYIKKRAWEKVGTR